MEEELNKESMYHDISDDDKRQALASMDEQKIVGYCYEDGIFGVTPMHWGQEVYFADVVLSGNDCCGWKDRSKPVRSAVIVIHTPSTGVE